MKYFHKKRDYQNMYLKLLWFHHKKKIFKKIFKREKNTKLAFSKNTDQTIQVSLFSIHSRSLVYKTAKKFIHELKPNLVFCGTIKEKRKFNAPACCAITFIIRIIRTVVTVFTINLHNWKKYIFKLTWITNIKVRA